MVHTPIKGYRELSEDELAIINETKDLAEVVGQHLRAIEEILPEPDRRWLSIGRTHLQQGFMAVIRGIAKPTTF